MKTYEDIFNEVVASEYNRINQGTVNIHRTTAKEFAKQWVKKAIQETHGNESLSVVSDFFKMIDLQ